MSDTQLGLLIGAGISLVSIVVTVVVEWLRASNTRKQDQERFDRERDERREQYARERAERDANRRLERRRDTLERLQSELAIVRRELIWYRNAASDLAASDPTVPDHEVQWQERQQTLSDADDVLMMLASRIDDEELSKLVGDLAARKYQEVWGKPPAPERADLAYDALVHLRKVRLRSGKLLQDL